MKSYLTGVAMSTLSKLRCIDSHDQNKLDSFTNFDIAIYFSSGIPKLAEKVLNVQV